MLKKVNKTYLAILKGHLKKKIKVDLFIETSSEENTQKSIISDNGKEAVSTFKPLKKLNQSCLVSVNIATGRTHQIRIHLKHLKTPILGDCLYGSKKIKKKLKIARHLLHAHRLIFPHPIHGKMLKVESHLPKDFKSHLKILD